MRRLAAVLALAAVALTACATGDAGAPPDRPGPTAGPTGVPAAQPVALLRAGGIAGTREAVSVDRDGAWRHEGTGSPTSGTLTAGDRDALARLGADPALAAEADRPRGEIECADGYEVSLSVGATTVRWYECGPEGDRPPVSAEIARLLARATG